VRTRRDTEISYRGQRLGFELGESDVGHQFSAAARKSSNLQDWSASL
jgi:hypothetical protein